MSRKKSFWYWVKYAVNNGGKVVHEDMNLSMWGNYYSKLSVYVGKTKLTWEYKREMPVRFNWIERL